jgi:hypothetical protein
VNNEQAFPSHGSMGEVVCEGMTLRDYFAAKAMQALIIKIGDMPVLVSSESYIIADSMLKARK